VDALFDRIQALLGHRVARGATHPGPAIPAALDHAVAGGLAITSLLAAVNGHPTVWAWVWVFNLEGTADFFLAIALATLGTVLHRSH
jgi:hypothetical protein